MTNNDAASILGLDGELNPDIVKAAYRKACMKFHPDRGGSVEMMQAVNKAYEVLKEFIGTVESELGYDEALNDAINAIIHLDGIEIEICGAWVWVSGNTKPYKDILGKKGAGFFWASKKNMWYFRPEKWAGGRGNQTMEQIRENHGSVKIKKSMQTRLEKK